METIEDRCRDDAVYWFARLEKAKLENDADSRSRALRELSRLGYSVDVQEGK